MSMRIQQTSPSPSNPAREAIVEGFTRALREMPGGVPAVWADPAAAEAIVGAMARLTIARLSLYCRREGQDLVVMSARVLADALANEPALLELAPSEAAADLATHLEALWPQAAVQTAERARVADPLPETDRVKELRDLGATWKRIAAYPIGVAKSPLAVAQRERVVQLIRLARGRALAEGLTLRQTTRALEAAGDRWSDEFPTPASKQELEMHATMGSLPSVYLDERGQAPPGTPDLLAQVPLPQ